MIEDDCSFGAGAATINFHLDETNTRLKVGGDEVDIGRDKLGVLVDRDCRIGVNASPMPGVWVISNCVVGSKVCLAHDFEAVKMVLAEPRYWLLPNKMSLGKGKRQELSRKLTD